MDRRHGGHGITSSTGKIGGVKRCSQCGETKPLSAFSKHKTGRNGVRSYCKQCAVAYNKANPQIMSKAYRNWRAANRERVRATKRAWRLANPDKVREHKRAHHERHRETIIARVGRWQRENPELRRAQVLRRRGLQAGAVGADYTTAALLAARVELYGGRCFYCGDEATTIDHRVPLSRGGSHWPANLVPACRRCNSRKNVKPEREFRTLARSPAA